MDERSRALTRESLGALLGAAALLGAPGCNTITGLDALQFERCAPSFAATSATSEQGSTGGSAFQDVCPDGQVLVGVRAGVNDPLISGISGICAVVRVSEAHPYTVTFEPAAAMPNSHGLTSSAETESRVCPPGAVVVGFAGSTVLYDNNDPRPILARLSLVCAPLLAFGSPEAPSLSLGATTTTPPLGGADALGDGFDPIHCPDHQVARGILGRSGLYIDAFGLGCAEPALACPGTSGSSEE